MQKNCYLGKVRGNHEWSDKIFIAFNFIAFEYDILVSLIYNKNITSWRFPMNTRYEKSLLIFR